MSENRSSPDFSEEDLDQFQRDGNVKRLKLDSLSDAKLEDLSMEEIRSMLIRGIAMEVEDMHLAKSAWKKKSDLVIGRLATVCPHFNNILTSDCFQNELYRTLECTVEKTCRLEILLQSPLKCDNVYEAITFKDEVFVLYKPKDEDSYFINVYGRSDLVKVQDVIALPGITPSDMIACSVSNCIYVLNTQKNSQLLVVRITKEGEHKFSVSPLITELWKPSCLHVAANGCIVLYSWKWHRIEKSDTIVVYDASGSMLYKMRFPSDRYGIHKITSMSNGNLVLVSTRDENDDRTKLTEIDMNGKVLRQYQSSLCARDRVCLVGQHGRILLFGHLNQIELLDSEFNRLNIITPQLKRVLLATDFYYVSNLHYNGERNELVKIFEDERMHPILSIFHFSEEILTSSDSN